LFSTSDTCIFKLWYNKQEKFLIEETAELSFCSHTVKVIIWSPEMAKTEVVCKNAASNSVIG